MSQIKEQVVQAVEAYEKDTRLEKPQVLDISRRWAECLADGKFLFYRHREVEVGLRDVDWSGSHVRHQEWPAQLNRFLWLPHLAALYRETGDEEMAVLARRTIEDWISQHDYGADLPLARGDNTLNVSIRLGQSHFHGWWRTLPDLASSKHYDGEFVRRMLESTQGQIEFLSGHLSGSGNWRISQLDCILFCSLVLPGLEEYREQAVRGLNEGAHRQIEEDGSHVEHNPSSYHQWMCRSFTDLWRLGRARPELGLRLETERVGRMWDYAVCSAAPDGGSSGMHDGQIWRKGPGQIQQMDGRTRFLAEAGLSDKPEWDLEAGPSRWFPRAGQLFLRDGWHPEATYIAFDATRWGGAHCHQSRNSVSLYHGDRMLLLDPGSFTYERTDPYAHYGRSTRAHNTISPAGLNQIETDPDVRAVCLGESAALIACRYEGGYFDGLYCWGWREGHGRGIYGRHDRALLWIKGRCAVVFDAFAADGNAPWEAHWQLPPGRCELDAESRQAVTDSGRCNVLVRCLHANRDLEVRLREGETDPLLGWTPGPSGSGEYVPAPMLSMAAEGSAQALELVTLLLPFCEDGIPQFDVVCHRGRGGPPALRLSWPDGREHIVACNPSMQGQVGAAGPLEADGAAVMLTLEAGEPTRAFLAGGMLLRFEGETVLDEPKAGTYERSLR